MSSARHRASTRQRAGLAAVTVLALSTTAACHGADGTTDPGPTVGAPTSSTPAPSGTTPTGRTPIATGPTDATSPAITEPAPTSGVPSFPAGTGPAPTGTHSTCTSLTIAVLRGSGAPGQQFAALQFTNTGPSTCVLDGYPTVTLQLAGRTVGTPSTPAGSAASSRTLAPGAVTQAGLHDYVTNCDAPLSDRVTVVAPGSSIHASQAITLRSCTLRVDPLGAPS